MPIATSNDKIILSTELLFKFAEFNIISADWLRFKKIFPNKPTIATITSTINTILT